MSILTILVGVVLAIVILLAVNTYLPHPIRLILNIVEQAARSSWDLPHEDISESQLGEVLFLHGVPVYAWKVMDG